MRSSSLSHIRRFVALLPLLFLLAIPVVSGQEPAGTKGAKPLPGVINEITPQDFARLIFDWRNGGDFRYIGTRPAIVDFYATWCVPCHLLRPRLKEIAETYKEDIYVYSIDAESAPNLSYLMGVQAYPTLLFIPMREIPTISMGLLPTKELKRGVEEILLGKKKENNE